MYPFRNSTWHSLVASMLLLSIITAAIAAPTLDRERTGSLEAEDSRPAKKPKKSSDPAPVIRSYILFMAVPGKAHWDKEKRELRGIDPKA
ncbi:hypothetical protein F5878DRAFT_625813 [Lentinula raphanica]|uniref:Uncharacterized protein n=1 Tax=Lentinula raphanica TaxID=153919 RepID=A0AA38P524_9AGAR|nr:hypothetical protein F5878DRAFT_625813 [Lentinula raphanica]